MNHELIHRLIQDEASGRYSRRQILQWAAALGLSAPVVAALFAGAIPVRALAQDAENPLGVDPAAPLDVVIFKGGYGDDYAINVNDNCTTSSTRTRRSPTPASSVLASSCSRASLLATRRMSSTTPAPATSTWPRWSPKASLPIWPI